MARHKGQYPDTAGIAQRYHGRERRERCPICHALITARMLTWHLDKQHDEGKAAVLDPTIG